MTKIPLAVVGLNFGRHIVGQITAGPATPFFELAAVCDLDLAKAREWGERLGVPAYGDLDALLADESIRAVGLFTGPVGRAALIRKIIRAGRDVMTTKPFERDPDAALAVLREAQELGRVVHLNSPSPTFSPDLAIIDEWRRVHDLGRPVACRTDVWASYREEPGGTWYDDPAQCPVAPVFRLGIYLINDLVRLFGEAQQVQVLESRLFTGRPTSDNAQLGIQFRNGAMANVFASFCIGDGDNYRNTLVLNFESGTVYRNTGPAYTGTRQVELALVQKVGDAATVTNRATVEHGSGDYQWEVLHRRIHGAVVPGEVTSETIVAGLRIIHAMAQASINGGTAQVTG